MSSLKRTAIAEWLTSEEIEAEKIVDIGIGVNPIWRWVQNMKFEKYKTVEIQEEFEPDVIWDIEKSCERENVKTLLGCDCVFLIEVLEHLTEPIKALKNINFLMKPGGVIYISVPFINPIHDDWDFLRYTKEGIERVIVKAGLKVEHIREVKATDGRDYLRKFYEREGLRMSANRIKAGYFGNYLDIGYCVKAKK